MAPKRTCECGKCRKCKHRSYMREWYAQNAEKHRETARKSRARNAARARAYDRARYQNPDRKKASAERAARWRKEHPEAARAHSKVARALRSGQLHRQPCDVCGREDSHGHHPDYNKPPEVRWLCPVHHSEV